MYLNGILIERKKKLLNTKKINFSPVSYLVIKGVKLIDKEGNQTNTH